jgi:hypothetical protein
MILNKYLYSLDPLPSKFGMGEKLRALVEAHLTKDLRNYHVASAKLRFDWSESYGAGRSYTHLDGKVENFNRIIVFDENNNLVADGCMDFIANRFFFLAYWDLVTTWQHGEILKEKKEQGMPMSVWRQLPEALMTKHYPSKTVAI